MRDKWYCICLKGTGADKVNISLILELYYLHKSNSKIICLGSTRRVRVNKEKRY